MPERATADEVLLEFIPIGSSVKVSAIDPATAVEVSVVGPASAPRAYLERTAIRKLKYVLARRAEEDRA